MQPGTKLGQRIKRLVGWPVPEKMLGYQCYLDLYNQTPETSIVIVTTLYSSSDSILTDHGFQR